MRNDVVVYKTDKEDPKKELRLSMLDIETLLFLFEQTTLAQKQLHRFYLTFFDSTTKKPPYDTFKKRIKRFEQTGLVRIHKYILEGKRGVRLNILQLTQKGYQLLVHSKFLKDGLYSSPNIKKWERILAAKEVILDVILFELEEHGVIQSIAANRLFLANPTLSIKELEIIEEEHMVKQPTEPIVVYEEDLMFPPKLVGEEKAFEFLSTKKVAISYRRQGIDISKEGIEPDWLFKVNNEILIIQIDLGYRRSNPESENQSKITILEAIEGVIDEFPKDTPIKLLYIHADNTFPFSYPERTKRIQLMKSELQLDKTLLNNPNVSIYTCGLSRKTKIVTNALENIWGLQDDDVINVLVYEFEQGIQEAEKSNEVEYLNTKETLQKVPLFKHFDGFNECILVKASQYKELPKYYIPLTMREGELSSQYRLFFLSKQLAEYKAKYKEELKDYETIKILAIYPNEEELKNDILRADLASNEIIFCSINDLDIPAILNSYTL